MPETRKAAVIGGNRIPFARANGAYARASNLDMLTATLDGLAARFGLAGERLGEVAGGAMLKHSRDRDLTREAVLGSTLSPYTPAYDVQQACGTGLETVILVANKIALGQVDSGIAAGVDTASDAPVALNDDLRRVLMELNAAKTLGARLKALRGLRPGQIVPEIPRNAEPRTGLSMGEHAALTALEWHIGREEQDELTVASHRNLAAAYDRGFFDDLVTPYLGLTRDQNLRPDTSVDKLAKLKPVFGQGDDATMTAGNSTPLTDGASAVLLGSDEWAAAHRLRCSRTLSTPRPPLSTSCSALLPAHPTACSPRPCTPCRGCSNATVSRCRTSTSTRSTRRSPRRCSPSSRQWRTPSTAASGSASTLRWGRSTGRSSTSPVPRSPPATRSPPPVGGSSPRWRSCCTRRVHPRAV